jgi:hypothetical protein
MAHPLILDISTYQGNQDSTNDEYEQENEVIEISNNYVKNGCDGIHWKAINAAKY